MEYKIQEYRKKKDEIEIDSEVRKKLRGSIVLVTGAGGSIGGELCRQIAKCLPEKLLMLDICENGVYQIDREFENTQVNRKIVIANICDKQRMKEVFKKYKPDYVFHAAAHKHVHLMEENGIEAIKNNVIATYHLANCAVENEVKAFIFISTDKSVDTISVMGATKRIGELMLQEKNEEGKTEFSIVRFGNVFDSNGSVIPIFRNQILNGGPVTITDKRMKRYFMTIPEAIDLILNTLKISKGGEIFTLDMGKQVRIYEVAEELIKSYGYIPNQDIKIIETGIRKGEKIEEKLYSDKEELVSTSENKVYKIKQLEEKRKVLEKVGLLEQYIEKFDKLNIEKTMKDIIPNIKINLEE